MTHEANPRRRSTDTEVALLHQDMETVKDALKDMASEMKDMGAEMRSFRTWKAYITGAVGLLGFMVAVSVPVIIYLVNRGTT